MAGYDPEAFKNPDIQRHYEMIEDLALHRSEPSELKDDTVPILDGDDDPKTVKRLEKLKAASKEFMEHVYPKVKS